MKLVVRQDVTHSRDVKIANLREPGNTLGPMTILAKGELTIITPSTCGSSRSSKRWP